MNAKIVIIFAFILIIVLCIIAFIGAKEYFDTYYQHDLWDSGYYEKPIWDAALEAKYGWSEMLPDGWDVYDLMYYNIVRNRAYKSDPEYVEREITAGGPYNTQFSTICDNNYSTFYPQDMVDKNPLTAELNGNIFELSQAKY